MKNHWIDEKKYRAIFRELDEVMMEVWSEDGTLADLFNTLNDEQTVLFLGMKIRDCAADHDDYEMGFTVSKP